MNIIWCVAMNVIIIYLEMQVFDAMQFLLHWNSLGLSMYHIKLNIILDWIYTCVLTPLYFQNNGKKKKLWIWKKLFDCRLKNIWTRPTTRHALMLQNAWVFSDLWLLFIVVIFLHNHYSYLSEWKARFIMFSSMFALLSGCLLIICKFG